MKAELFLEVRFVYSTIWTLFAIQGSGLVLPLLEWAGVVVVIFVSSIFWQYSVLHKILSSVSLERRRITVNLMYAVSLIALVWSSLELKHFVSAQSEITEEILDAMGLRLALYAIAVAFFVGTACTSKAFNKHNALPP